MTKTKQVKRGHKAKSRMETLNSSQSNDQAIKTESVDEPEYESCKVFNAIFDRWEDVVPRSSEFLTEMPIDSLESRVGYSSLLRQMHQAFIRTVAYYKSHDGGSLSTEEARAKAFHACENTEAAKKLFHNLMRLPVENLNFVDLMELQSEAPRVAEKLWESVKREGRKEFESGHLSANINFPVGYMKQVWNIARYLGVRESFIEEWKPSGGIEIALLDMMTQAYFQWQYWVEITVKRSETRERTEHPEYLSFMAQKQRENRANGWSDGHWFSPTVSEQAALEHAVQMADRWNRIFMRTLRQLRDLRRYTPVTINNPTQVNIATDGGKQVNVVDK